MIRLFRHYVPTPLIVLAAVEAVVFVLSVYLGVELRYYSDGPVDMDVAIKIAPRAFVFALVMMGTLIAFGLYTRESQSGDIGYYGRFLASFIVGGVVMALVIYLFPRLFIGRGALALAFMIAFVGSALTRLVFVRVIDHDTLKRRLLVLGIGTRSAGVSALLEQDPGVAQKFHLVGYFSPGARPSHPPVRPELILKDRGSLLAIVTKYGIDEVVVGVRERRNSGLDMRELLECKLEGVQVTDLSSFFERETGHVQLDSLNPSWMVYSDGFQRTSVRRAFKRVSDVLASLVLLAAALPVMAMTALLIVLETGRPVFYRQERIGECGQVFSILKFRSMYRDAERGGTPQWAHSNDSRVTRVGRVIRRLRIDELPQLFNILRGEMSFVGPRPERPYYVKQLAEHIPYFLNRHAVKPGLTGWAQIRYRAGASIEDARQKLQYDLYYVKNQSLFLDLVILLQTARVVLFGSGNTGTVSRLAKTT